VRVDVGCIESDELYLFVCESLEVVEAEMKELRRLDRGEDGGDYSVRCRSGKAN
jgi:hypothetical protein